MDSIVTDVPGYHIVLDCRYPNRFFSCKSFFSLAKKAAFPPVLYYLCICIYPVALIRDLKIHTKDVNTYVYMGTNF